MKIAQNTAMEIAKQLSETIGQNINLMDTDGIIIASSDPSRIGKLHGGAKKLIDEHLEQLIVEDDTSFAGAKSGVNLPIKFNNELVGTIGITGPVDEVLQYGKVIKRMTEILLLDNLAHEQRTIAEKAKDRFLDEWVIGGLQTRNEEEFKRLAVTFDVKLDSPIRIAVLALNVEEVVSDTVKSEVSHYIRKTVKKELAGNAFRTATSIVCILRDLDDNHIEQVITDMYDHVRIIFGCEGKAGIDSGPSTSLDLSQNYQEAMRALEIARRRNTPILIYNEFDLDFLMGNISQEAREKFLKRLFGQDTDNAVIKEELTFANAYLEENGSLTKLSERLFVHKNTVKYRIGKLTEMTGIDIRTCKGAYLFSLAIELNS